MAPEDDATESGEGDEERTETDEERQRRIADAASERGEAEREGRRRPDTYRPPLGYPQQRTNAYGGRGGSGGYGVDEPQQRGWQQVPRRQFGGREPERGRRAGAGRRESASAPERGEGDERESDESEAGRSEDEGEETEEEETEIPKYGGPFEPDWQSRRRWGRSEAELRSYEYRIDRALERQRDLQRNKSGQPYHRGRR
ncbi:hypothetical protein [Halomicrococcus sp. NG-SE-24]|uniref:hypothetical protein n=1 Tax=Halomicrococcus sp. NG-SE-24 TaxID=3436928 RepID=UPI003D965E05